MQETKIMDGAQNAIYKRVEKLEQDPEGLKVFIEENQEAIQKKLEHLIASLVESEVINDPSESEYTFENVAEAMFDEMRRDKMVHSLLTPDLDQERGKDRYVIIHHNDADGWGALGLALNGLSDPTRKFVTRAVNYSDDFSKLLETFEPNDHVYILDFSFDRNVCDAIAAKVQKLVVLDHHKTAEKALEGAPYATFDMSKSGVLLAFEHFFPDYLQGRDSNGDGYEFVPPAVRLLDNYDLWKKNDSNCAWHWVVGFHLFVKDKFGDFTFWRELMGFADLPNSVYEIMEANYLMFKNAIGDMMTSAEFTETTTDGFKYLIYPCENDISLIADAFRDSPLKPNFTASYKQKEVPAEDGRDSKIKVEVSLRGSEGYPVLSIAEKNGGGGHEMASGFFFDLEPDSNARIEVERRIKRGITFVELKNDLT